MHRRAFIFGIVIVCTLLVFGKLKQLSKFQVDGEEDASCSLILLYALFINLFFKKGGQISPLTVYINENPPQVPLGVTRT